MTIQRRRGFTLIELLVVIAIIAILVALLLPAVQQVREAARKSQCQDHLHNLAIAVANYEGNAKVLPPGAIWSTNDGSRTVQRCSILVHILPYVEQKPLYDIIDFNMQISDNSVFPGTTKLIRSDNPVAVYVCPSDTAGDMFDNGPPGAAGVIQVGAQNYSASIGSDVSGRPATGNGAVTPTCTDPFRSTAIGGAVEKNGVSGCFYRVPSVCEIADMLDGTSNTIWFGEVRPECSRHVANGWLHSNDGQGMSSTTVPINYDSCKRDDVSGCQSWSTWTTEFGFRSRHAGGAQFAFGDGVVRFLSENVDHTSYQRMGGKADGQPVNLP
ncbi:MAG: DUF1559 domain-containing protein [Planctomycetaceae bacterium]